MDRVTMQSEVKKALSETVLLRDGRFGYVISELPRTSGVERWECHVCSKTISTERAMLMHLSHPLHMNNMRLPHHNPRNFFRTLTKDEVRKLVESKGNKDDEVVRTDNIDPSEPPPPGMEDMVGKLTQLQVTLDLHPGPLIGLEYIVELVSSDPDVAEPSYICLLCEKKGDPRSVMVHLTSHNHNFKYISCFFRTAGHALNMMPWNREYRKGLTLAVTKIAQEIEKIHGRLKPTSANLETFPQHRQNILKAIEAKEHFRETPTTTFIEYVTIEKIRELSRIAEYEINRPGNRVVVDETKLSSSQKRPSESENKDGEPEKKPPSKPLEARNPNEKLSFRIGKPARSLGRNPSNEDEETQKEKDNDFIDNSNERMSTSTISSDSGGGGGGQRDRPKYRSRSREREYRSRGGSGERMTFRERLTRERRLAYQGGRRSPPRRRSPDYRDRSRSRSPRPRHPRPPPPERYHRKDYPPSGRERRSRSFERSRYESRRRRSISLERERRHGSPYGRRLSKSPSRGSPYRSKYSDKSSNSQKRKELSEYELKMQAYRKKLHELEVEMEAKLKYYKERPEKHPQYSDEWKNFWNRRYKELQQEGKDPTGYDFKPEWIIFWDERVGQLHEEEVAMKKEDLKEMLPKPEDKKGPSSDLQDISPPTPESQRDVTVDDIKNTWKALTGSDIKAPPKARSPTPHEDSRSRSPMMRRSPSPWEDSRSVPKPRKTMTYVADPPIVHVLRMLSVVEHQLGSLAPKALELLSQAILLEKERTNESMTLLQETDVHIFFETVKEKIRGQLIAGIVQRFLVSSCRSIIHTIENMLAAHPLKPKAKPKPKFTLLNPEPVKVEGVGLVNKMAVAQQIAEALISQGRMDVSEQELEELINAVTGLASSSNANVNQSSTAFFSQLNIQKSTAAPRINELLSNIISSAQRKSGIQPTIDSTPPVAVTSTAPQTVVTSTSLMTPSISSSLLASVVSSATSLFGNATSSTTTTTTAPMSSATAASIFASLASSVAKSSASLMSTPTLTTSLSTSKSHLSTPLISEKPVEVKTFNISPLKNPSIPLLSPSAISARSSSEAFSAAVSAAKATVSELASAVPKLSLPPAADKPLFPLGESSTEKTTPKKEERKNPNPTSDEDLKERLMKFKSLSRDEQQSLIALLKDLETKEPERVEKLRKYVALGLTPNQPPSTAQVKDNNPSSEKKSSRLSPFSSRAGGVNPGRDGNAFNSDNDDDDDYTVEDVYKSVSEKLKKQEPERRLNMDDEENTNSSFSNPSRPLPAPSKPNDSLFSKGLDENPAQPATPDTDVTPIYKAAPPGWPKNMYMEPGFSDTVEFPNKFDPSRQQSSQYSQQTLSNKQYNTPPDPPRQETSQYTQQPPSNNQYTAPPNQQYNQSQQYSQPQQYNQSQQYMANPGGDNSDGSYSQGMSEGRGYPPSRPGYPMSTPGTYNPPPQQQYPNQSYQTPTGSQQPPSLRAQPPSFRGQSPSFRGQPPPFRGQPPYNYGAPPYNYQQQRPPQGQQGGYYGDYRQY